MSQALLEPPVIQPAIIQPPVVQPASQESSWTTIRMRPAVDLTDEEFFQLCQINETLRLERTAEGDLIVMPPTGGETSTRNFDISAQLSNWTKVDGTGTGFDSSGGFKLPNGAERSPDGAWVLRSRLAKLTVAQKQKSIPLCPDFVIELRSPSDALKDVQAKMAEYIENGARLGWLIDPLDPSQRRVHVYRPGEPIEILEAPAEISGDPELPGFVMDLREIWEPNI
jgi:Uma2 family endonuclease